MRARSVVVVAALWVYSHAGAAGAQPPADEESPVFTLRDSLKSSVLLSQAPGESAPGANRGSATGFWRWRVEPAVHFGASDTFEFAFEQRVRVSSITNRDGANVLPTSAAAPFRIRQLDWQFASSSSAEWRGEIDRAAVHVHRPIADLTIGRQAIGWGRGVLFSAVDTFSPFTPLEADREWKRGVDAVRVDAKIADHASVDVVAAFGDSPDRSAYAARLRGYAGKVDVEFIGGRRARDVFGGMTSSAAIGDLEAHGELVVFRTPAVSGSTVFGESRMVPKAILGGSYRFGVGAGLPVWVEYHYSGFGAPSADRIVSQFQDPAFQERYLRGDTQILGRHATVMLASYEWSPEVSLATEWLQSPVDGSGVVVPSATLTFGDRWSMVVSGYVPHGPALNSEFGGTPLAAFVQVRMYR